MLVPNPHAQVLSVRLLGPTKPMEAIPGTRWNCVRRLAIVGAIVALPAAGYTQEATLAGTVTDATGGVLRGVKVTARHAASGNTFVAITDERGMFRIPLRIGQYDLTAEAAGFAILSRSGLEILVGQQAVLDLQMGPSGVQESIEVTAALPLIDANRSTLGSNIDARQLSELPLNGRNWMDLTMLARGSRLNAVAEELAGLGAFQINLDGQQVTQRFVESFGQPRFSRDAITEFEFISNRFDASQGRSTGLQVNAVTKSGSNTLSGMVSGYFRDDRFNAADFIQQRVLPYSNQQVSATLGGPLRKDKIHFFGNYEFEREPLTFSYSSPYPRFNIDQTGTRRQNQGGLRLDAQFTPQTRLAIRGAKYNNLIPYDPRFAGGAIQHPSAAIETNRYSDNLLVTVSQVLGPRAVNELKGGYAGFRWTQTSPASWPEHPARDVGVVNGTPRIVFAGYAVGQGNTNTPQRAGEATYAVRDDFTSSFTRGGRHEVKIGGEYFYSQYRLWMCALCMGYIDAQGGRIPDNIEELFPVWNDVSTWNLAALSPITRFYLRGIGGYQTNTSHHRYAGWIQDDWTIANRLTLNLGLRYDLALGVWSESVSLPPFLEAGRPADKDNLAPRLGFAFKLDERTVLRGGFGRYFGDVNDQPATWTRFHSQALTILVPNDGRPDFAANPFNGSAPTFEEALEGGVVRSAFLLASPDAQIPHSNQTSIGVQRQVGGSTAIEADYVFVATRHDLFHRFNINLAYDPATGLNYPFTNVARRPYPGWGTVGMLVSEGRSSYHALQTAFTKRFSRRWQASGTYTLSGAWDEMPPPVTEFEVAPDLGGAWTLAAGDQRHRAVVSGIWQPGLGFQLSGLYLFGSGARYATIYGGDLRGTGGVSDGRLRPDGTIVPRNNFVGKPIHRVDVRVQRRFPLGRRLALDGILEVFNLFNHANYGSYVTAESNRNYGKPADNNSVAYRPRMLQVGFRVGF
jgi:hypothetical protein